MVTSDATLTVSRQTYDLLARRARTARRKPDELADELLRAQVTPTEHPYIVCREGVRGGRPIMRGSSVPLWLIIARWKAGDLPEEIGQDYPHIEPAAIYDAISYYFDHRQEVEADILANRIETVLAEAGGRLDERNAIVFPGSDA